LTGIAGNDAEMKKEEEKKMKRKGKNERNKKSRIGLGKWVAPWWRHLPASHTLHDLPLFFLFFSFFFFF